VWDNLFRGFKLKLFSIIKLYFLGDAGKEDPGRLDEVAQV